MGELESALDSFLKSKNMNAAYEKARNWHEKVLKEMENKKLPVAPDTAVSSSPSSSTTAADGATNPPPAQP